MMTAETVNVTPPTGTITIVRPFLSDFISYPLFKLLVYYSSFKNNLEPYLLFKNNRNLL
jgi:hypothetical protein